MLWILRILLKVNQVIYILDTICDPNIMTLAQAVLEIFCSQSSIRYILRKHKRDKKTVMDLENLNQKLTRLSTPRIQPVNQI